MRKRVVGIPELVEHAALALGLHLQREVARGFHASLARDVDQLGADYVTTLRAARVPRSLVLGRHVLRNSAIPTLMLFSVNIATLLGGTVVIEKVFAINGIGALLFVPVFKTTTPPPTYMGIMFGLGVLWVVTEIMHRSKHDEHKHPLSVVGVLRKIDTTSILFFLGILLAVSALATAGHLIQAATLLKENLGNVYAINIAIGLLSAVVDNVPLVAGSMKMYPLISPEALAAAADTSWLGHFVVNGTFWEMLAYCAGTGGSCLIIGSAAGVAAMGMEKIDFIWYLKRISLLALLGYLAGAATYIGLAML